MVSKYKPRNAGKSAGQSDRKDSGCRFSPLFSAGQNHSAITKESPALKKLDAKTLTRLGEKLLDFQTLDEVHEWIDRCAGKKTGA